MTATQDITMLCTALDAGDDTALLPLADALEEAGDPRAAGVHEIVRRGLAPVAHEYDGRPAADGNRPEGVRHQWTNLTWMRLGRGKTQVPLKVWKRTHAEIDRGGWVSIRYGSRSLAYLALAEALSSGVEV